MNLEELSANLGLDKEDYLELIELLIESGNQDLANLRQALAQNDPETAAKAAHSLKGAAANLGLTELSELAKEAELQAKQGTLQGMEEKIQALKGRLDQVAELAS
ncbi:MAG: Hpt domain-containing protein [Deltaproteobacteria bacterium]|nr:Hpt domain-containing protein [Deltaproteobacteria bacterium]MBW1930658.1 Hpt domain-containing protein [Deltaproteobacteria bacterium]MBW2023929.1 Hpt domain-containing protein [Deltaproteobacteria bacterium]MBW2124314.1 Hpt domain-containing protein [Deltaproteobacteria bacterium]RLB20214.1 MAG: Hpt domain-containing protein [Deltaproteobacteria bacterium]